MEKKLIVTAALGVAGCLVIAGMADAAEIKVLSTQATEEAYRELVPQFEKASGHKVTTVFTGTLDANKRLAAGETYDLLIMSSAVDRRAHQGRQGRPRQPRRSREIGRRRRRARPARRSPTSAPSTR